MASGSFLVESEKKIISILVSVYSVTIFPCQIMILFYEFHFIIGTTRDLPGILSSPPDAPPPYKVKVKVW